MCSRTSPSLSMSVSDGLPLLRWIHDREAFPSFTVTLRLKGNISVFDVGASPCGGLTVQAGC